MATTGWPSSSSSLSPMVAIFSWLNVSAGMSESCTATTARSLSTSVPLTWASTELWSTKPTESWLAPSTTWLLVAMSSSDSFLFTITPVPAPCTWISWVPPKKLRISSTDMVEMVTTEGMASLATATTASLYSALAVTLTVLVWGMLSSSAAMLPPR